MATEMTDEKMIEAVARAIYKILGYPASDGGMDATYRGAAAAALRAVREAQGWKDISEFHWKEGIYETKGSIEVSRGILNIKATQWRDLPTPPEGE